MSLAHAFRKNARRLAQAQNTYKENVIAVNTLVTSVLSSNLPTLIPPNPPDWDDFTTAFEQANADALDWVNNVMARLFDVPADVQGYNNVISQVLQDAKSQATTLVSQPSDQTALEILNQDLTTLSRQLSLVITFISGAVTNIENFQDKLPDMATQLSTIAQKAAQDANADQQQIDGLLQAIAVLQADIKDLTAALIALGIADAAAITLGLVATIAAWPVGLVAWFVLGPAVAVTTTYIALDAQKIEADKASIQDKQQQMQGLTADVATLQVLSQNFSGMAAQAAAIETNLQAILAEWQTLESDVNAAISEIQTAASDTSGANFTAVVDDLNDAIAEWNAAYAQAGSLAVELNVNNAPLQSGMTSDQVKTALAAGQTFDIITFYNQMSGRRSPRPVGFAPEFREAVPA